MTVKGSSFFSAEAQPLHRPAGVSVIIASAGALEGLSRALESVARQDLSPQLIEVILVRNGDCEGVPEVLDKAKRNAGDGADWKLVFSPLRGVSRARNLGLQASTREFVTFLDDDDWIEPSYLSALLEVSGPKSVAVAGISNIENGCRVENNSLNSRIRSLPEGPFDVSDYPWLLGFVACKLVPWALIADVRFDETLSSGEDVVFFAQLLGKESLVANKVSGTRGADYVRSIRPGSVSRRSSDYGFSVSERVECVLSLKRIDAPIKHHSAIGSLIRSQLDFVSRFLVAAGETERSMALDELALAGISEFAFNEVDREESRTLVISHCFPPYSDPSGNVVAKRIIASRRVVDVISNRMAEVRPLDRTLYGVVTRWIGIHHELELPNSFSDSATILRWSVEAAATAEKLNRDYERVYSRALWVHSHLAAAIFKLKNPSVEWVAEISDPLTFGTDGKRRVSPISRDDLDLLPEGLVPNWVRTNDLFELTEKLTLVMADRVMFTNKNQRRLILDQYSGEIRDIAMQKSVISEQPVPPREMYSAAATHYFLDRGAVNIAYFGSFYSNRGIGKVVEAINLYERQTSRRTVVHIFTDPRAAAHLGDLESASIRVNAGLDYLQFLALAEKMDVLLVTDTDTEGHLPLNPYLPSKYADYAGANSLVWGIVNLGSPLSEMPLDFRTMGESREKVLSTLFEISNHFRELGR